MKKFTLQQQLNTLRVNYIIEFIEAKREQALSTLH